MKRKILLFLTAAFVPFFSFADKLPNLKKSSIEGYYFADDKGKMSIFATFRSATAFNAEEIASISFDGHHYALMGKHGQIITDFNFPSVVLETYKGLSVVKVGDAQFLYNLQGQTVSPEMKNISITGGCLLCTLPDGQACLFDGDFKPIQNEYYSKLETNKLKFQNGQQSGLAVVGWGTLKNTTRELVDMDGQNIFPSGAVKAWQWLNSEYFSDAYYSLRKAERKSKLSERIEQDRIVIGSPDGGASFGVYLLDGTEVIPPKSKTVAKACLAFSKEYKKRMEPLLANGTYARNTQTALLRLDSITRARAAQNTLQLKIDSNFTYITQPIKYYFCSAEKMSETKTTKSKTKSRKKRTPTTKTTYQVLSSEYTAKKYVSEKFSDIKECGVNFACRKQNEKKYNLYNQYGLPMTFDGYDEIKLWHYNESDEPLFLVRDGNAYGLISALGTEILTPQYSELETTTIDGLGIGKRDGKFYLLNSECGRTLNGVPYDSISEFGYKGTLTVSRLGYETRVDKKGKENPTVAQVAFQEIYNLHKDNGDPQTILNGYYKVLALCGNEDRYIKGSTYCNLGVIFANAGQTEKAKEYYKLGAKFGSQQAAANYKSVRAEERSAKWAAFSNALNTFSQAVSMFSGEQNTNSYGSDNSDSYGGSSYQSSEISTNGGGVDEATYLSIYRRWENNAKSNYESLTRGGTRTYKGGQASSGTADGYWRHHYSELKRLLREAQSQMRKTRQEARRAGFNIPQSNYETVTVTN